MIMQLYTPIIDCLVNTSPKSILAKNALKIKVTAPKGAKITMGRYPIENTLPIMFEII